MGRLEGEWQRKKLKGLKPKRPLEATKKTRRAQPRPCWRATMLITERVPEPVNRTRENLVMGPLRRGSAASPIHGGLEQPIANWAKHAHYHHWAVRVSRRTMEKGIAGGAPSARPPCCNHQTFFSPKSTTSDRDCWSALPYLVWLTEGCYVSRECGGGAAMRR